MMNFFRRLKANMELAVAMRAREEARCTLLRMSDRNLQDIGISREKLEMGVGAWPWQVDGKGRAADTDKTITPAMRKQAIRELQAYSDRELHDLGLSRGDIVDAVNNGRPGIDRRAVRDVA